MCETIIITQKGNTVISRCSHCEMLFIWQNNLMINFTRREFASFTRCIEYYNFDEHAICFADEVERIYVQSPNSDIGFMFTREEWILLREALQETVLMIEVYQLMQ